MIHLNVQFVKRWLGSRFEVACPKRKKSVSVKRCIGCHLFSHLHIIWRKGKLEVGNLDCEAK